MNMFELAYFRLFGRRNKKYWVAALCAASFACGHCLFGNDDNESESLLSQYQQATQQLIKDVQPPSARRQTATTRTDGRSHRPEPVKAEETFATSSPTQPQKSSRRVKPSQQPVPDSVVVKAEPSAAVESVLRPDSLATDQSSAKSQPASDKTKFSPHSPVTFAAPERAPPASEETRLPIVTQIEVLQQPALSHESVSPRMEIITPGTASAQSPRWQDSAAKDGPFVAARSIPIETDVRQTSQPQTSQPLPQIINVSRQIAPLQPPKAPAQPIEVDDEHLPPIVSPDQVPRPGTRKRQLQQAAQATPVLRIDLGK
jgi:hypothetical protein